MKILDLHGHYVDVLYVLLLYSGKYDFLPDLYDTVGHDLTVKLLDVFAGSNLKFPSTSELERLASEVRIYLRLKSARKRQQPSIIRDLADERMTTEATIRNIYARVTKIVERDLGLEVLSGRRRFRKRAQKTSGSPNRRREESP